MKKIVLFFVIVLSACGTLFSGANQDISFDPNIKSVKVIWSVV